MWTLIVTTLVWRAGIMVGCRRTPFSSTFRMRQMCRSNRSEARELSDRGAVRGTLRRDKTSECLAVASWYSLTQFRRWLPLPLSRPDRSLEAVPDGWRGL
jgi:hypothetical protein